MNGDVFGGLCFKLQIFPAATDKGESWHIRIILRRFSPYCPPAGQFRTEIVFPQDDIGGNDGNIHFDWF
jgi:hypothetical protein